MLLKTQILTPTNGVVRLAMFEQECSQPENIWQVWNNQTVKICSFQLTCLVGLKYQDDLTVKTIKCKNGVLPDFGYCEGVSVRFYKNNVILIKHYFFFVLRISKLWQNSNQLLDFVTFRTGQDYFDDYNMCHGSWNCCNPPISSNVDEKEACNQQASPIFQLFI